MVAGLRLFSPGEKLDLVTEYLGVPHGAKTAWLAQHGVSAHQIRLWRRQYFAGDLERDLRPRTMKDMPTTPSARLVQLEKLLAQRDLEIERLHAELDKARRVNDVLGKAIELVDRFLDPNEPTPTDKSSSPRKTNSSAS